MTSVRTSAIVLVILVAALGLAVAVYELTRPEEVSAQEVVQRACDQTAVSDYDFSSSFNGGSGEDAVEYTADTRISGEAFHMRMNITKAPPRDRTGQFEIKSTGDFAFWRELPNGRWRQDKGATAESMAAMVRPAGLTRDANPLCPLLGRVERVDASEYNGVRQYRFTEITHLTPQPNSTVVEGEYWQKTWDMWVDSDGKLARTRLSMSSQMKGQPEATPHSTLDTTISGVGEANTITAPVAGS